jgi:hypothetical protein
MSSLRPGQVLALVLAGAAMPAIITPRTVQALISDEWLPFGVAGVRPLGVTGRAAGCACRFSSAFALAIS